MTLFVSTACLPENENYWLAVKRYTDHGIINIELGSSHQYNGNNDISRLYEMPNKFLIHNYFPPSPESFVLNLASHNPNIRQQSIKHIKNAITLSAALNAPFYSFHAGFITDPHGFGTTSYLFPAPESESEAEQALSLFVEALEEVGQYAQTRGIHLLVENNVCTEDLKGKLLLQTADEFLTLFQRLSIPNIGILLDFGHLNVTAHTLNFDRMTFIDRLAPNIKAFHIHDNDGTSDAHEPITPKGWVDTIISDAAFANIPAVLEAKFNDIVALKQHLDWLLSRAPY